MAVPARASSFWGWHVLVSAVLASSACTGSSNGDDDSSDPSTGGAGGRGGSASGGSSGQGEPGGDGGDAGAGASSATGGAGGEAGASGSGDGLMPTGEASRELGDEGGVVAVGFARLVVPPGALAEPTTITLRLLASETSVLDDVYEMLPSGLEFLEPARFVLDVGPEHADPDGEPRVLTYVDGPAPVVLSSSVSLPTEGTYAAAVRHFSRVAAARAGAAAASGHFGGFDFALPYAVNGSCGGLESEFSTGLPTSDPNREGSAAETNVDCSTSRVTWKSAASVNGQRCATLVIPDSARQARSTVFYPSWDDRPAACDKAWDDFLSRLSAHEKQHQTIGKSGCKAALDQVNNTTACGDTVEAAHDAAREVVEVALEALLESTKEAQAALDTAPDHGVTMDCNCECEDPCEHFDQATQKCVPIECAGECEQCVDGQCQDAGCDECVPKSAADCPSGSTWNSGAKTCTVDCTSGGSIAGLPCVYSGTSSTTLVDGGITNTADVTFEAKGFDGCLIVYEPTTGTVTAGPLSPECSIDPSTQPVEAVENHCIFKIMPAGKITPASAPYLVADCGSVWNVTLTCEDQSVPTMVSGLWLYTPNGDVASDKSIVGSFDGLGLSSTFAFSPE